VRTNTAVQTLDYYPYGATRISSGNAPNKRDFIGQFNDPTNLSYLNARYYDSSRGQFLSEDPVFWTFTDSINGAHGNALLLEPQRLNSSAYSADNPLRFKDPDGRYWELSVSGALEPFAGTVGVRSDQRGSDWFYSVGGGHGVEAGVQIGWAPGQSLTHQPESSISLNAEAGIDGVGARASQRTTYSQNPRDSSIIDSETSRETELLLGAGAAVTGEVEYSHQIPCFDCVTPYSQPRSNSLNFSIPASLPAPSSSIYHPSPIARQHYR
jgi:RHS repeat-associated protein